ncbi:ribosome assembly RNA-binding protein YhbY [Halomonas sp. M20]|uniref:ribosome assembly RNA-binding protein YhbY n=1 Tax=Halomonas sp. M20 TaxID=2763264 RepID=UPI001D0B7764|nr:ribosome assembly RNA-binding protein YhbY [Halomonas sp. M20]
MSLSQAQKKAMRSIGHHLHPVVTVAENGLTENVMAEIERALADHELIKIKLAQGEREMRQQLIDTITRQTQAEIVQTIGKMALFYRTNPNANPKLSNVVRASEHHGRR